MSGTPTSIDIQSLAINPGKGLGLLLLGASFRDILERIKSLPEDKVPNFKVQYAFTRPFADPINLVLPGNGLRLRFDAIDQRLRLIEVQDFSKVQLTYKGQDLVKKTDGKAVGGPSFKYLYGKVFGPTFEGERVESLSGTPDLYVLSYPGVAFHFHIRSWPKDADFVSMLSAPSTSTAVAMAIFNGSSWPDARKDIWTRPCPHPRSLAFATQPKESVPDEVEEAIVKGKGVIELRRKTLPPFKITISETTAQDLILSLGPPDEKYQKNDRRLAIHTEKPICRDRDEAASSLQDTHLDTDQSSINTNTDFSSHEDDSNRKIKKPPEEWFWNYFSYGFDILLSQQLHESPPLRPGLSKDEKDLANTESSHLVATKVLIHGNLIGAHDIGRYRRLRWVLDPSVLMSTNHKAINSETFFTEIRTTLDKVWASYFAAKEKKTGAPEQRHMVLNRGWGDSPSSSVELLGGWEDAGEGSMIAEEKKKSKLVAANTDLWGYPGLVFEVLKNDAVACLTVY